MEIFKEKNNSLESINQVPFKLEKDIQKIVEENTQTLFNLEFIASEVSVGSSLLINGALEIQHRD